MSCFLKSEASVTTPSSPSHQIKRSASGRFAKAAKGTSNKMNGTDATGIPKLHGKTKPGF